MYNGQISFALARPPPVSGPAGNGPVSTFSGKNSRTPGSTCGSVTRFARIAYVSGQPPFRIRSMTPFGRGHEVIAECRPGMRRVIQVPVRYRHRALPAAG